MLIDVILIIFAFSAIYRGRELGLVRQLFAAIGFIGGLFLGAALQPKLIHFVEGQTNRTVATLSITLGCAIALLMVGEAVGIHVKRRVQDKSINRFDAGAGSVLNVVSLLFSAWLLAALVSAFPSPMFQASLRNSQIIAALNHVLPEAPDIIARLGRLVDPNGFPQVFIGGEPSPRDTINLPSSDELRTAVDKDRASVVKLVGQGCGGIVDGSGFVVGTQFVATNAHVVAGIRNPYVQDSNGNHKAVVIYFDPNLDLAVLRVSNLAGSPLSISSSPVPSGTAAAVMGYPGGGNFTADPAAITQKITASGRNIYGRGNTLRQIYELKATVIPGNSGGPVVARDGSVIGVVFAQSTSYDQVGYALTSPSVVNVISKAMADNRAVGTGSCAE